MSDGDSVTAGTFASAYINFLTFPNQWVANNTGVSGYTTAQMLQTGSKVDALYVAGKRNIVTILGGENDCLLGGTTAATSWANLAAYAAARHTKGWKVIVMTIQSIQSFDACRNAINAQIYANWSGVFDGLADLAADPNMGPDGSWSNATYFVNGTHPSSFGEQNVMAPLVQTQANLFIP